MATIQVRDIPADTYAVLHSRARVAGQSLQAYMRERILELADSPTDEELFAEIERSVRGTGVRLDVRRLVDDIAADRE